MRPGGSFNFPGRQSGPGPKSHPEQSSGGCAADPSALAARRVRAVARSCLIPSAVLAPPRDPSPLHRSFRLDGIWRALRPASMNWIAGHPPWQHSGNKWAHPGLVRDCHGQAESP